MPGFFFGAASPGQKKCSLKFSQGAVGALAFPRGKLTNRLFAYPAQPARKGNGKEAKLS